MQSLVLKPTQISWHLLQMELNIWGSWEKSCVGDADPGSCDKELKHNISEIQIKLN